MDLKSVTLGKGKIFGADDYLGFTLITLFLLGILFSRKKEYKTYTFENLENVNIYNALKPSEINKIYESNEISPIEQVILRGRDFFLGTPFFIISFMLKSDIRLKLNMHSENLEFNAYQIEIESNRKLGKIYAEPIFGFLIFFLIFFQIFMIRFGRTELELRASFALNLLNLMLYSNKYLVRFGRTES